MSETAEFFRIDSVLFLGFYFSHKLRTRTPTIPTIKSHTNTIYDGRITTPRNKTVRRDAAGRSRPNRRTYLFFARLV